MPVNLARIIGSSTLRDVENAFTLDHPDERYSSTPRVEIKGDVISVEGELFFRDVRIGDFYRQLHFAHDHGVAEHQVLEIAPAHRGRDIAKHHYRRAIRFYDRSPIREVHLFASGDGPWIWPQLGFDLVSRKHKERLRKIASEHGFFGLPPADRAVEIYAADIATTKLGDHAIGVTCLQELDTSELEMILRLDDTKHRAYLISRGMLPGERRRDETGL